MRRRRPRANLRLVALEALESRRLLSYTPPTLEVTPFGYYDGPLAGTASPGTGVVAPDMTSPAGVDYATGGVSPESPDLLVSSGFGSIATDFHLGWTNLTGFGDVGAGSPFGTGMDDSALPYIVQAENGGSDGGFDAIAGSGDAIFFAPSGTNTYAAELYSTDTLASDGSGGYEITQSDGTVLDFYGFGAGVPTLQQGQLRSYVDAGGNKTSTSYNTSGQLTDVERDNGTNEEDYHYTYATIGGDDGQELARVSAVALERGPLNGSLTTVQAVALTYYSSADEQYGDPGELEDETEEEPNANGQMVALGTTYFRYYTATNTGSGPYADSGNDGDLQYEVNEQSYARLAALLAASPSGPTTVETDTDSNPYSSSYDLYYYANYNIAYLNDTNQVSQATVQGGGCSCTGSTGNGTYGYSYLQYAISMPLFLPASTTLDAWATDTVEALPDGDQDEVYSNSVGEPIAAAYEDTEGESSLITGVATGYTPASGPGYAPASGTAWVTGYQYDSAGRPILVAQPSAVTLTTVSAFEDAAQDYPDVLGYDSSDGTYANLSPDSGLIDLTTYDEGATTATSTSPGNVAGYLEQDEVEEGYDGTPDPQDSTQYEVGTGGGLTVYYAASSTVYAGTGGAGAETTTYYDTYYPGTVQVETEAETLPIDTTYQDDPGTVVVDTTVYNTYGWAIWTKDGDGFLDYTSYYQAWGVPRETIVDVDTTQTGEFAALPSGWATPAGGGLNLVTAYVLDELGRVTEETSPAGNVTYTVYDDPDHEVRVYPGWDATTGTTTGPTQVTREDWVDGYDETLTMSATPATSGSAGSYAPTGAEAIAGLQSLSRDYYNTALQETEEDDYYSLSGLSYSTSAMGTKGTNYYATTYGYDAMGRQDLVDDANGTITVSVYYSFGLVGAVYVGTNDGGFWPGSGGPDTSNMVATTLYQYDDGGVGDGDLTEETDITGSGQAPTSSTLYAYDYQDRLIETKEGALQDLSSEQDDGTNRPITFLTLDNLGDVTETQQYDGDGIAIDQALPADKLVAESTTEYDAQGRPYEQAVYEVDQSSGAVSSYVLTTLTFYDHRGDVIAVYAPGGEVTKDQYDGAGRLVSDSTTDGASDGGGSPTWAEASSDAGDHVITQTTTEYDGDGNATVVTTADRDNNAPTTLTGALLGGPAVAPTGETVVDNSSSSGFATAGSSNWSTYSDAAAVNGTYAAVYNAPSATATWTFNNLSAGQVYVISATWASSSVDASSATFSFVSGGTTLGSTAVDQQEDPSGFTADGPGYSQQAVPWQDLGTFAVTGSTLVVTLHGVSGAWIVADAVMIRPANTTQVVDNSSQGYGYQTSGSFTTVTGQGYGGSELQAGSSASTVTSHFSVTPGLYAMAATWANGGLTVPDGTTYTFYNGSSTASPLLGSYTVDQQDGPSGVSLGGASWTSLGATLLVTGGTLTVVVSGPAGFLADALLLQQVEANDARVSTTQTFYDAADRPTETVDVGTNGGVQYIPSSTIPDETPLSLVTFYLYNAAGYVNQEVDPLGIDTLTRYDALGRVTEVIDDYTGSPGTPTASSNQATEYTYDGLGDVTSVSAVEPSGDPEVTTYTYGVTTSGGSTVDSNDLLASTAQPGGQETTSTYDALGDVLTSTDANGTTHSYTYDSLGRLVEDQVTHFGSGVYDPAGAINELTTAYDALGNADLFTSYSGTTFVNQVEDVYDGFDQLVAEYQNDTGEVYTSTTPSIQYSYSTPSASQDYSRLVSETYPDGRVLDYQYNSALDSAISRIDAIVDDTTGVTLESYQYLGLGTVVEEDHPQTGVNLSYIDQSGQSGAVDGDGGDEYTGLDRFGRVIDQDWYDPSDNGTAARYQYGYDLDGDVTSRADVVDPALSQEYTYDDLGRLTKYTLGSSTVTYNYDALGNQVSVTTNGTTSASQTFNSDNQDTTTSTYDNDGNTTSEAGFTYVYDAWGRLVSATSSSGQSVTYEYDALGRRVAETDSTPGSPATVDYLYYDGSNVIEERAGGTAASDAATQYVWGVQGNLILRDTVTYSDGSDSVVQADRLYAVTDANGDVTALIDAGGGVVERYEYSPYGAVTVLTAGWQPVSGNTSAYGWLYLFQGGRVDTLTGLYEFGARDYNPVTATWMEQDPIGFAGGTDDFYQFVGSDPIEGTDPSGFADDYWGGSFNPANWGIFGAGVAGTVQGGANIVNGAQEIVLGGIKSELNTMTFGLNNFITQSTGYDPMFFLDVPDWSYNLITYETRLEHNVSKYAGGGGALILISAPATTKQVVGQAKRFVGQAGSTIRASGGRFSRPATPATTPCPVSTPTSAPRTFPANSITPGEAAEIQAIANKYNTTIDVVGSRAAGEGREIGTNLPVGKNIPGGPPTRSDIDFRIDAAHPQIDALTAELQKVGNGAGTAGPKWSTNPATPGGRDTVPPYIRFTPGG